MERQEVMVNGGISNGDGVVSCGNGFEELCSEHGLVRGDVAEKVAGNLAEEVLEDLEEYWEDISDRLMISRMVSDSVIKGMLTAVEQEAAEKIAAKELEMAILKERLQSHGVSTAKYEDIRLPVVEKEYEIGKYGKFCCSPDACKDHEKLRDDLSALWNLAREQFKKVKKEIELARGSNSLKKIGSASELVGLGGILHETQSESWMQVNKMLDSLKTTVDTVCRKMDDILLSSNISFLESQQDLGLLARLEDVVKHTALRSLQCEFEENLLEQNAQFCGVQNMNWLQKFNDISDLATKLDAILKSLSVPETELLSHGSHDLDHLHHYVFCDHATPSTSLDGENGTVDASSIHVAESYDFQQLKHMSKEELVNYFNDIITKLKRDHESTLHQKTEEYFRLKREYLNEKGSFMTHWREEEFDVLRNKIPEVISKLENFLSENERFLELTNNLQSMGNLKHRLDSLLSTDRDLSDCLTGKENEVKCLKEHVSYAAAELLQHPLAEENMLKLVANLKSAVEDSCIEASLDEEVYKCALREQIAQARCDSEDSNVEFQITREICDIFLMEAAIPAETANRYGIEGEDFESLIMQGLDGLILTEAMKDTGEQLNNFRRKVLMDEEIRVCLETKVLEKENEQRLEVEEKEKLKQEVLELRTAMEQQGSLTTDLSVLLSKEREQFQLASQELTSLRQHASQQQTSVAEINNNMESLRSQHLEALEEIELNKVEMHKLDQELDQIKVVLAEAEKERDKALTLVQEMHDELLLSEAREQTLKKEMEMAANGLSKIFDDFECGVSGAIKRNCLRLEETRSNLNALTEKANVLKRIGLMYKHKLERRCTDLQMAEVEVDLLGDEVDSLLRLLEKIYIALDHYSPILKHYPGIIEILELVRRDLTGESTLRP